MVAPLGTVEIDEVELVGAVRDEARGQLGRRHVDHRATRDHPGAAHVDGRDDHHGRRFMSAGVRG